MANATTKKVVLFVVEGPSEETALGQAFETVFDTELVKFDVVHGDLTVPAGFANNPRERVRDEVLQHLNRDKGYRWGDLARIVQICDTDGAFIPDDKVVASNKHLAYGKDRVEAARPEAIRRRNHEKAAAMKQLASIRCLTYKRHEVPFKVYFLSRNMEHALHGICDDCTDEEKKRLAHAFRRKYGKKSDDFKALLRSDELAVSGDYIETWRFVGEGTNSLKRGSNLHLVLPEN